MNNYNNFNTSPYMGAVNNYGLPNYNNNYGGNANFQNFQQSYYQQQNAKGNNNNFVGIYVNGVEEANKYILGANQTIYMRDNTSDLLFVKTSDSQGKYSLKAYHLIEDDTQGSEYVKKADFSILQASVNKLSESLEKFINEGNFAVKTQNNRKVGNDNAK